MNEPIVDSDQRATNELEEVSRILLGVSRQELIELQEDKSKFVEHMSASLGEAVREAGSNKAFRKSMAPVVADGVMETARRKPMELGEAIAPAMGPALRSMISLALEKMNQRVETMVKTTLSLQGLKWRLEAKRSGVDLADIVLRETLVYRVEHVLLIHKDTGTLLAEASQEDVVGKDPAVVSSMLTVVRDFVVDAFGGDEGETADHSHRVGDLTASVESIGTLALAAVVRGTPTSALREQLRASLEKICIDCGVAGT